jgi:hypothetical protein
MFNGTPAATPRSSGRGGGESTAKTSYPRDLSDSTPNGARVASRGAAPIKLSVPPQKILQAFNTWAFKREQPTEPLWLQETVASAIARNEPIPFVLYWGKGPRATVENPEIECLRYLGAMMARIRDVYTPGAAVKLICTDTHAILNGHAAESISGYFEAVSAAAKLHGFDSCLLSDLCEGVEPENDATLSAEMLQNLSDCARKWFRGEGTAEEGAVQYYKMNMIEKRAVEIAFPNAVFVTFNGSEFRSLFPKSLPVFYMYSLRRGCAVKPWFLPATPAEPAAAAPAVA